MAATLRETVRKDGLRIVSKRLPGTKRSLLFLTNRFGSAYDPKKYPGAAHFLEHALFCGTTRYSKKDIKQLLDYYCGGDGWNAYTFYDSIFIHAESLYSRFKELCALLFHLYNAARLPKKEVETERRIILQEIAMRNDELETKVFDLMLSLLWQNNPQAVPIIGTKESVLAITTPILKRLYQKWFTPSNAIICATGKVEHDLLVEQAEEFFPFNQDFKILPYKDWDYDLNQLPATNEFVLHNNKDCKSAYLNFGCKVGVSGQRQEAALLVLSGMLDFVIECLVREESGLAYSIFSSYFGGGRLGYGFSFFINCDADAIEEVKELVFSILCKIPLDKTIFKMQKEILYNQRIIDLENPKTWSSLLGRLLAEGRDLDFISRYIRNRKRVFKKVTFDEVLFLRKKFLQPERIVCAMIVPVCQKKIKKN